ncbi:MAG TPA: S9 family peptidase [Rudaea sp.]|jgi:dipeptidyl aminopeptidase/acylaminoacyl peptidase|uniref:S9 family peptidase n=1 Tax=Rudaea sp. TaxID=2136325 RepID=UPI002F932B43
MKTFLAVSAVLWCASAAAAPHAFDVHDLVMLDRVSDPQLSADATRVAYQLRETDYAANKGKNSIWVLDLKERNAKPLRLTDDGVNATSPRWSPDGATVYFQAKGGDAMQVWSRKADGKNAAVQVTGLSLDVNNYKLSPDGRQVLLSIDTFAECAKEADAFACTKKHLDDTAANKATGKLFDKLFIRHWDTWADGRRSQLYIAAIGTDGKIAGVPKLLSQGIDGDVPSKPFGDDSEFAFSPNGRTVYFDVRIAGRSEPWSTNFDIYSVPADGSSAPKNLTAANAAWDAYPLPGADGKTLYYLAMKRPTFEADRFGIMALDLASGQTHEIDPQWDRSPGGLQLSKDGKTLYTTVDDNGDHPLFAVDTKTGKATKLSGAGQVEGFSVAGNSIVIARSTLKTPADLFRLNAKDAALAPLTHLNTTRLAGVAMGDYEFYTFKGAGDETVQGYVVKPANFEKGKKYPVAFIIHGGPQGAWTNEFHYRWNPQTYAGQGFAVVTVNFHGSTGYGQKFTDAISGDWGGAPLDDLQKGWAAALQKYDFLDGNRACALGASYGGYMIYWIAGNWPQPWKCLVDHDGVFDSRMMAYSTEELWFDEWEHHGTQWEKPEAYEKFNPVNYVAKWTVPMLVVHSEKDFRIPVEQGIAAFTALQRRGIPSEFLTFPDENHWVLKPQNSVLWHDTVNAWLKKWTSP